MVSPQRHACIMLVGRKLRHVGSSDVKGSARPGYCSLGSAYWAQAWKFLKPKP